MKFKEKLLIFVVAVVLSLLLFNLIASSSVCLLKAAKEIGFEEIERYQARCDIDMYRNQRINNTISQLTLQFPEFCH